METLNDNLQSLDSVPDTKGHPWELLNGENHDRGPRGLDSSERKGRGLRGTVRRQVIQATGGGPGGASNRSGEDGKWALYDSNKVYFGSGSWKIYFLEVAKPRS